MMETICDKCGQAIEEEEANNCESGEYEGATLCNDCYAEVCTDQGEA